LKQPNPNMLKKRKDKDQNPDLPSETTTRNLLKPPPPTVTKETTKKRDDRGVKLARIVTAPEGEGF
ncbi:hypothetical protein A2U01_0117514, partial [Trifolium medium]|nr:hypothetical protein [Trifolium medium]